MKLDNIIDGIIFEFDTNTQSFKDSIKTIYFDENGRKYRFNVCTKTMKILQDNLTIELKKKIYNILNRKLLNFEYEKMVNEYGYLYDYLEKTDKLDYIVEKRECPDFRIFNNDEEEYIEVTQDVTRQEAMIIKCLNSYYYGRTKYEDSYKKYLNIRKVSDGIIVAPKFKTNKKVRSENLYSSIQRKINKYTKYINEMPEIIDGTKAILVKMKSPYTISNKQKQIVKDRVYNMIKDSIVEKVIILTNDNDILIVERDCFK